MVANILPHSTPPPPPPPPPGGVFFSEHGHVAYQIKGNHVCSNMVANILSAYSPLSPWGEVQILLFHYMVLLHVKLKNITNATTWKQIVCLKNPSLDPGDKIQLFQNMVM